MNNEVKKLTEILEVQENDPASQHKAVLSILTNMMKKRDIWSVEPTIKVLKNKVDTGEVTDDLMITLRFPLRLWPQK